MLYQQQQQLQQLHQQKQAILSALPTHRHGLYHSASPRVQKVVPAKGSVEGGMEVTLLGRGFLPGMIPTFDGVPALNVQVFGPDTILCRTPPRSHPGVVVVKAHIRQQQQLQASQQGLAAAGPGSLVLTMPTFSDDEDADEDEDATAQFEYEEDKGDRDLIALALQVLGMKMNGRVEPPNQVAMRIMAKAAEQQHQQDMILQHQRNTFMAIAAAASANATTAATAIGAGSSSKALTTVPKTKNSSSGVKSAQGHGLLQQPQQQQQPSLAPIPLQSPGSFLQFNTNQPFAQHRPSS